MPMILSVINALYQFEGFAVSPGKTRITRQIPTQSGDFWTPSPDTMRVREWILKRARQLYYDYTFLPLSPTGLFAAHSLQLGELRKQYQMKKTSKMKSVIPTMGDIFVREGLQVVFCLKGGAAITTDETNPLYIDESEMIVRDEVSGRYYRHMPMSESKPCIYPTGKRMDGRLTVDAVKDKFKFVEHAYPLILLSEHYPEEATSTMKLSQLREGARRNLAWMGRA